MPKVTEQYREAKRDQITDAALRCFAAKGFGASMADIIAESGLSAGAIYGHFAGKAEVMQAVAVKVMGSRIEDMQSLRSRDRIPSPGEVLTRILTGLSDDVADTGLLLQVWGESVTDPSIRELVDVVFGELRASYLQLFTDWAKSERGLGDAEALEYATRLTSVAVGLGQGYIAQSALFREFDGPAYLAMARELLPH